MSEQPAQEMTMEEFSETITGFEEIAISKHFDEDWSTLPDNKPTMFMRALVMVDLVRKGGDVKSAKQQCMEMSLKDANGYFAAAEEDALPDEPDSESGKDGGQLEPEPTS